MGTGFHHDSMPVNSITSPDSQQHFQDDLGNYTTIWRRRPVNELTLDTPSDIVCPKIKDKER